MKLVCSLLTSFFYFLSQVNAIYKLKTDLWNLMIKKQHKLYKDVGLESI